jgi:hypothetical protein
VITIHTDLPAESALQLLRDLVASGRGLSGEVSDGHFFLRLTPGHRKACPVTVSGHISHEAGRTLVTARALPSTVMIVFFFVWVVFGGCAVVGFARHPTSRSEAVVFGLFVLAGIVASGVSFRSESRRAYEIIKKAYAA